MRIIIALLETETKYKSTYQQSGWSRFKTYRNVAWTLWGQIVRKSFSNNWVKLTVTVVWTVETLCSWLQSSGFVNCFKIARLSRTAHFIHCGVVYGRGLVKCQILSSARFTICNQCLAVLCTLFIINLPWVKALRVLRSCKASASIQRQTIKSWNAFMFWKIHARGNQSSLSSHKLTRTQLRYARLDMRPAKMSHVTCQWISVQ